LNLRPLGYEPSAAPFKLSGSQTGQSTFPPQRERPPWQPTASLDDADALGADPVEEFNWQTLPPRALPDRHPRRRGRACRQIVRLWRLIARCKFRERKALSSGPRKALHGSPVMVIDSFSGYGAKQGHRPSVPLLTIVGSDRL
jgi:hypothetical protein